mmetsp:Transcript_20359/g.68305  ORF Transcript_20359/g.68305 Transcript_20359/m.68305 type:complete len:215 (-) Transcript_20359:432-1076(-)
MRGRRERSGRGSGLFAPAVALCWPLRAPTAVLHRALARGQERPGPLVPLHEREEGRVVELEDVLHLGQAVLVLVLPGGHRGLDHGLAVGPDHHRGKPVLDQKGKVKDVLHGLAVGLRVEEEVVEVNGRRGGLVRVELFEALKERAHAHVGCGLHLVHVRLAELLGTRLLLRVVLATLLPLFPHLLHGRDARGVPQVVPRWRRVKHATKILPDGD